jgi:hypothetical protein
MLNKLKKLQLLLLMLLLQHGFDGEFEGAMR